MYEYVAGRGAAGVLGMQKQAPLTRGETSASNKTRDLSGVSQREGERLESVTTFLIASASLPTLPPFKPAMEMRPSRVRNTWRVSHILMIIQDFGW